jgi:hypothetical protein
MLIAGRFVMSRIGYGTFFAVLMVLSGACQSKGLSRDGQAQDGERPESGRMQADSSLTISVPDAVQDVASTPQGDADSADGPLAVDLGPLADIRSGDDTFTPPGCEDQNPYVDVSDGREAWHLVYGRNRASLLATGKEYSILIDACERPDGGACLWFEMRITDPKSAITNRVGWTRGAGSGMNDRCGGNYPVTISQYTATGGILEGDFERFSVGYSCEGIEANLRGHFRVCYLPTM